jgi:hypothetical protein
MIPFPDLRARSGAGPTVAADAIEPNAAMPARRWAVVLLKGVAGVPADAMLDVADRLRRAVCVIGIADVRIEVTTEDDS